MIRRTLAAAAFTVCLGRSAMAQDASYGCQVLLCAAMAGGWQGTAYCVKPMAKALRDVARGKAWPWCAEASMPSNAYLGGAAPNGTGSDEGADQ